MHTITSSWLMCHTRLPLQAQLEGPVPATDNLDVLGLDPKAPLPTVSQPPPPPLPLALFDADVPCSVQQLFRIVMGPDAAFIRTQHATHKYWDVSISEWAKCAGECRVVTAVDDAPSAAVHTACHASTHSRH
jgi:hypothetical protein